jgi:beta-mannosidase
MAAVDYFRVPTRSYGAVKQAFQMVLPSLEYDRDVWRIGEQVQCGVWIINDHWYAMAGCRLIWKMVGEGGRVSDQGQTDLDIPADSSRKLFDVQWRAAEAGKFRLMATVLDKQGATVSENDFEFEVR